MRTNGSRASVSLLALAATACLLALSAMAHAVPNPVLSGVGDAGVMHHNGTYYVMGVGTFGAVYMSDDLLHWRGPTYVYGIHNDWAPGEHVADVNVHPPDTEYLNGNFHLYVQTTTLSRVSHSVSRSPLGPFVEPVRDTWLSHRIDPDLFIDDDGTCYLYTVRYNDGNVIWGQAMHDPWTLEGEAKQLITAGRDTWEMRDCRIVEGPTVTKFRGRYYLLYNANHTGDHFGNYAIGCAVADSPLGFTNAHKQPAPLLDQNTDRLEATTRVVAGDFGAAPKDWCYATVAPEGDWQSLNYDDSNWNRGKGAFGHPPRSGSRTWNIGTEWTGSDIWLRQRFTVNALPSAFLRILAMHPGRAEVTINGVLAYQTPHIKDISLADVRPEAIAAIQEGDNVLAVHAISYDGRPEDERRQCTRFALLDPITEPGEDFLYNPGQPNLIRGPNGFEWWLMYFGIFNGYSRSQAADRAFFFGRDLFVDGMTNARTPGYHPAPAAPTFGDSFKGHGRQTLGSHWNTPSGAWSVAGNLARQTEPKGSHHALVSEASATHYLLEASVHFTDTEGKQAGLVAWHRDNENQAVVGLDQEQGVWFLEETVKGKSTTQRFALPRDFDFQASHTLKVTKNGRFLDVWIDSRTAPGTARVALAFEGKGAPGLFCADARAAFDHVTWTIGWDEFDDPDISAGTDSEALPGGITGWGDGACGRPAEDDWKGNGPSRTFKGDLMPDYDFSVQVDVGLKADAGRAGIYAVYIDERNYLRADIDMVGNQLRAHGMRDAAPFGPWAAALAEKATHHLRAVKLADRVILFADGCELLTVPGAWPASQIGLVANDTAARFNGITLFQISPLHAPSPLPLTARVRSSASFNNTPEHCRAMHDGLDPAGSDDYQTPRFTFWGRFGTEEWARYDFDEPTTVSTVEVYWYDDHGGVRLPESWTLSYLDGGTWREAPHPSGYSIDPDRFNLLEFKPIRTRALRLHVRLQPQVSAGIMEWRIVDPQHPRRAAPPAIRPAAVSSADPTTVTILPTAKGTSVHYTLDQTIPTTASARYTAPFQVGASSVVRARSFESGREPSWVAGRSLWVRRGRDFYRSATASRSNGPPGLDLPTALNDGIVPVFSHDMATPRLTWWDRRDSREWVQYDFQEPRAFHMTEVYWFDDDPHGGCRVPREWRILYRDGEEWKPVTGTTAYGTAQDQMNHTTFDPVVTDGLRLEALLQKDYCGGIMEWRVE